MPGVDRIGAEARTDSAFFDNRQIGRQRACPEQHSKIIGAFGRKAARNLPAAAQDRFPDLRSGNHLVIKDDREKFADILLGGLAEALCAFCVETERNHRLARALIECRLRVDEVFTRNDDPVLDEMRNRRIVHRIKNGRACRRPPFDRLLYRHGLIDHLERQLCRLAENVLKALRILKTRDLDENTVYALALDDRFGRAELVDAAADNFDRLRDGGTGPIRNSTFRERKPQQPGFRLIQGHFIDRASAENPGGNGLRQGLKGDFRLIGLISLSDTDLHRPARPGEAGIANLGVAQHRADVVSRRLKTLVDQILVIDLREGCAIRPGDRGRGSSSCSEPSPGVSPEQIGAAHWGQ